MIVFITLVATMINSHFTGILLAQGVSASGGSGLTAGRVGPGIGKMVSMVGMGGLAVMLGAAALSAQDVQRSPYTQLTAKVIGDRPEYHLWLLHGDIPDGPQLHISAERLAGSPTRELQMLFSLYAEVPQDPQVVFEMGEEVLRPPTHPVESHRDDGRPVTTVWFDLDAASLDAVLNGDTPLRVSLGDLEVTFEGHGLNSLRLFLAAMANDDILAGIAYGDGATADDLYRGPDLSDVVEDLTSFSLGYDRFTEVYSVILHLQDTEPLSGGADVSLGAMIVLMREGESAALLLQRPIREPRIDGSRPTVRVRVEYAPAFDTVFTFNAEAQAPEPDREDFLIPMPVGTLRVLSAGQVVELRMPDGQEVALTDGTLRRLRQLVEMGHSRQTVQAAAEAIRCAPLVELDRAGEWCRVTVETMERLLEEAGDDGGE